MRRRLEKVRILPAVLSLFLLAAAGRAGLVQEEIPGSRGAVVTVRARSFAPGDALLLTLEHAASLRQASVHCLGRDYILRPAGAGGPALAFIGLDFGLKSRGLTISVSFDYQDGSAETVERSFPLEARTFRARNLRLPEKYIVPPPEAWERIARDAELLAAVFARVTPVWLGDGRFILPHEGFMNFNFGERRSYNGRPGSPHGGVDIDANLDDPIIASNAGIVVLADDLYYSGNTAILDHGLGVFTSYLHMSRLRVRTGDLVAKGAILGDAGSTGRSTGPHLHWSVTIFRSRVDPRSLLRLPID